MSAKTGWLALLVLAGMTQSAQAQVMLMWKFQEGEVVYLEKVEKVKQSLDTTGKNINQESTTTTVSSYTVKEHTAKGTVLVIKVEGIESKSNSPDSAADDKVAQKMKGIAFTVTLNPAGKISKLGGYEDFIKKLADGDEKVEKLARMRWTEESLKKDLEETFVFLPPRPVAKGDTWKRDALVPLGPFGSFKVIHTYTLDGKEKDIDAISLASTMTYSPPTGDGVVAKVVKGALKAEEAKGRILFDVEKGRLVEQTNRVVIRGNLTVEIMDNEQKMEILVDLSTTLRMLSKNPLAK